MSLIFGYTVRFFIPLHLCFLLSAVYFAFVIYLCVLFSRIVWNCSTTSKYLFLYSTGIYVKSRKSKNKINNINTANKWIVVDIGDEFSFFLPFHFDLSLVPPFVVCLNFCFVFVECNAIVLHRILCLLAGWLTG